MLAGLLVGDPHDAIAVRLEDGLLVGVVLAGELVVVPGDAVGLDRDAPVAPEVVGDDRRGRRAAAAR